MKNAGDAVEVKIDEGGSYFEMPNDRANVKVTVTPCSSPIYFEGNVNTGGTALDPIGAYYDQSIIVSTQGNLAKYQY
ncbi:MAG: hypothetical protein HUJ51_04265 [Eggerthellaceae bacterium]|nr:hypothetical protein [Eggerthellaceae bacterium]